MNLEEAIKYLGVKLCEFDCECDFCSNPKGPSYVSISVSDLGTETNWYACATCLISAATDTKAAEDLWCAHMEEEFRKEHVGEDL